MISTSPIPDFLALGFIFLPFITWLGIVFLLRNATGIFRFFPFMAMAWMTLMGWLALKGFFIAFQSMPPRMPIFMAAEVIVLLGMAWFSPRFGLAKVSAAGLIGLQAFRIPTEFLLAGLADYRLLPVEMTYSGRNFDILTGLLALPVALTVSRLDEKRAKPVILIFNLLGLILLAVVAAHGILSLPTPFQQLHLSIENVHLARYPLVFLPFALVGAALFLHALSLRRLFLARAG